MNKKQIEALKKGKEKSKELCGNVINICNDVSILADRDQYIVKYGSRQCYFDSLEHCFNDIFQDRVKARLVENQKKDMKEIIKIHKETARWLKSIFRKTESVKFKLYFLAFAMCC